jgi:hypothetical protein
MRSLLANPEHRDGGGGDAERRGVEHGDRAASGDREQPGAGQRGDQLGALLDRHPQAVQPGPGVVGQHDGEQGVLGRIGEHECHAVAGHHRIEQPYARGVVHEQQGEHHRGHGQVADEQQAATPDPVGHRSGQRRQQ